jgi:ATP-dependent DNA ligase
VLDGEIVSLDRRGRPQFKNLLFRRGQPSFIVFDLLYDMGKDLRHEQLLDQKVELRRPVTSAGTSLCCMRITSRNTAKRCSSKFANSFRGHRCEAPERTIRQ